MLANLREKLLNVNLFSTSEESPIVINDKINVNSGASILEHFQKQWEELHQQNEENAKNAEEAAQVIDEISKEIKKNNDNIKLLTQLLATSGLSESISNCLNSVTHLYESAELVETDLIKLEEVIDEIEFQKMKSQHRYHLQQYEQRKEDTFQKVKATLEMEHTNRVKEYEASKQKMLKERQKVFNDAFKSDIETYKSLGTVPKNDQISNKNGAILEEIELDFDQNELDQFFND